MKVFIPVSAFVFLRLMLLLFSNKSIVVTQPSMNKGPLTTRQDFASTVCSAGRRARAGATPWAAAGAGGNRRTPSPRLAGRPPSRIRRCASSGMRTSTRGYRERQGQQRIAMTSWGPSEYLLRADGRHIADFAIRHQARSTHRRCQRSGHPAHVVRHLRRRRREDRGRSTLYRRHPGIALVRVSYRNTGAGILSFRSWTNGDFRVLAAGTARSREFWCYSGASYEDRRDWVQPVEPGFAQDNFLGMEASDYGGGTPIVDVWRRDGGLAVGHVGDHAEARFASRAGAARLRPRGRVRPREARPQARRNVRNAGDLRGSPRRRLFRRVAAPTGASCPNAA